MALNYTRLRPFEYTYEGIEWTKRDVCITKGDGTIVFQQKGVEAPDFWSDGAVAIVAQKYLRGKIDKETGEPSAGRETSIRGLIDRVVDTIGNWAGYKVGDQFIHTRPEQSLLRHDEVYFESFKDWQEWQNDLKYFLVNQFFAFNSPVFFNVGIMDYPQISACFITRMDDQMTSSDGILKAVETEGRVFIGGSGSGINLSRLRSTKEWLSGGGQPSGPLSFARVLDINAQTIKSGGKTRRAATMRELDVDHPDIMDFIKAKSYEEGIAHTLAANGYGKDMDSQSYQHAFFQNANFSVRVDDLFMEAVENDDEYDLISRSEHHLEQLESRESIVSTLPGGSRGRVIDSLPARDIFRAIAEETWKCGDPGIQFHDTINEWNTAADTEPIHGSNPCSEYMYLDGTACNLASINLKRVWLAVTENIDQFYKLLFRLSKTVAIAMDVLISNARYPTDVFRMMSHKHRTLGLGFTNLGGLLMHQGISYASSDGQRVAGMCMKYIHAGAVTASVDMAKAIGACEAWYENQSSTMRVIRQHSIEDVIPYSLEDIKQHGVRNMQWTVLAPTGTISFMMDAETTGIEPQFSLLMYKQLAGGGGLDIINPSVKENLLRLGYSADVIKKVMESIWVGAGVRGCGLKTEHERIFLAAVHPFADTDTVNRFEVHWKDHIAMMAACQPYISGAISKTVNMPNEATVEDIKNAYMLAWKSGLKAVAIYRDGSKLVQAISTTKQADGSVETPVVEEMPVQPTAVRRRPPQEGDAKRVKFSIAGHEGYLHPGFFEDGELAEIFVRISKQGSTLLGMTEAFSIAFSLALQHGCPLETLATQFRNMDFEPRGPVFGDKDVRMARSIPDYIVRKLMAIMERKQGETHEMVHVDRDESFNEKEPAPDFTMYDAGVVCPSCGSSRVQMHGTCTICLSCGSEEGGCFG